MNNEIRNKMVERILTNYGKELFCTAYKFVKKRETAEDIVQQTYAKLLEKFHTIREIENEKAVKTFALTILRNLCFDYLKRQEKTAAMPMVNAEEEEEGIPLTDILADDARGVEDTVMMHLNIEKLRKEIKKLPFHYQKYIVLKYYFQYNDEKIAASLHVKKDSVRTMGSRAKSKLKILMEDQGVTN